MFPRFSSIGEQSCPTPPRHPAVRSDATCPWYVRVLDSTGTFLFLNVGLLTKPTTYFSKKFKREIIDLFPDMPCIKRVYTDKRQPGTKNASRPADKPVINRRSTADFVFVGLHWISLVRASGETLRRRFFGALEGTVDFCFLGE